MWQNMYNRYKLMNIPKFFPALLLVFASLTGFSQTAGGQAKRECFMILVGKNASAGGTVLLAHNNDLTGSEPSHLHKYSREVHPKGDSIDFPSGLSIPQADTTYAWLALKIQKGYAEGDAVAINEYGVAVAGGVALKPDRNVRAEAADPLVEKGVTGGIRYVALQRSRTARQCVKMIGDFYTRYGVTYPSGIGIADTNEIWYIESGGGHCWAAVRIPDSCYWPQANGYRIGYVDPGDTVNYYCSPGLLDFCETHGLWNPGQGRFDFAAAFGGGRKERNEKPFYDTRRIWRCFKLLTPSVDLSPEAERYPQCLPPDQKISLTDCFAVLRDRYEKTPFESIVDDSGENGERPIASRNAVHTDVISLKPGLPVDAGAVMWAGIGSPLVTVYVPFAFGTQSMDNDYFETDTQAGSSAFRIFKELADHARNNKRLLRKIRKEQSEIEKHSIEDVNRLIDDIDAGMLPAKQSVSRWDDLSEHYLLKALKMAERFNKKYSGR